MGRRLDATLPPWATICATGGREPLPGSADALRSGKAAVIGNCSLRGGKGTGLDVAQGVIVVRILANGMDQLRFGSNHTR